MQFSDQSAAILPRHTSCLVEEVDRLALFCYDQISLGKPRGSYPCRKASGDFVLSVCAKNKVQLQPFKAVTALLKVRESNPQKLNNYSNNKSRSRLKGNVDIIITIIPSSKNGFKTRNGNTINSSKISAPIYSSPQLKCQDRAEKDCWRFCRPQYRSRHHRHRRQFPQAGAQSLKD